MSRAERLTALLRWYPQAWRQRYGDEFIAMLEDSLNDEEPTLHLRTSVAFCGLRERGHEFAVIGSSRAPRDQMRAGALIVLVAWLPMVLAGVGFAKSTEHFARVMPGASRHVAQVAYDLSVAAAIGASLLILVGTSYVTPTFVRFLRGGGWSLVERYFVRALGATLLSAGSLAALAYWAYRLDAAARNGGNARYSASFVVVALICAATLAIWTYFALQVVGRLGLSPRVLRAESRLAEGVAAMMVLVSLGAGLWWRQVGQHASWFLQGTVRGVAVSPFSPNLVLTTTMMVVSSGLAGFGVLRIVTARRRSVVLGDS